MKVYNVISLEVRIIKLLERLKPDAKVILCDISRQIHVVTRLSYIQDTSVSRTTAYTDGTKPDKAFVIYDIACGVLF